MCYMFGTNWRRKRVRGRPGNTHNAGAPTKPYTKRGKEGRQNFSMTTACRMRRVWLAIECMYNSNNILLNGSSSREAKHANERGLGEPR